MRPKVILGGGVSGLSAAYYLRKKFPSLPFMLMEGSNRTGGWIKSTRQPGGYIFEQGPRMLRVHGKSGLNTLELIEELNLGSSIKAIKKDHPAARNRMLYANGKLHMMPTSFWSIFKTMPPFSKPLVRFLLKDLTAPAKYIPEKDESIYSFIERRFGNEVADYGVSPLICGICAGNAQNVSVKFLMEGLFNSEQAYGSITKGIVYDMFRRNKKQEVVESELYKRAKKEKWSVYSLSNGLETLTNRLEEVLLENNVNLQLDQYCAAIEIRKREVQLYTIKGEKVFTKHLISCIPAHVLAKILVGHPQLKELLHNIKWVKVGVVNLHFNENVLNKQGFGFLVPPKENLPVLGVTFDSCCFPHFGEGTVLTVMMGGHWFNDHFGDKPSEDVLLDTALKHIEMILGITKQPDKYKVNILSNCIPQYIVGHNDTVDQINKYILDNELPLSLCGASYYGIGINDIIMSSRTAIDNLQTDF